MTITLPHRYTPRETQLAAWRAMDEKKRVCIVWHRRCGKDKLFFNKLIVKAMERMANYAYYFPTAALGKRALWENVDTNNSMRVIDHIPAELLARAPNQTEMKIRLVNGSTIQVLGTDDLNVVGGNFYGTVWSEMSLQNPVAWDLTRPILAENGGWAWFNGTPRGKNHFHRMFTQAQSNPEWFAQKLTVDDTGSITQADIEEERRAGMSDDMIRQEFYCDFNAANPGAIYAKFIEKARDQGRVNDFPISGSSPVHTAWDLGSPRNTVVWYFQTVGREIRVLRCDMDRDETITERVARMKGLGLNFGTHFLPHDARQTDRTGRTLEGELRQAGLANIQVVRVCTDIWAGINHLQELFQTLAFRETDCAAGLAALEAYHTREVQIGKVVSTEPVHDWSSHAADGLRTMAEAHSEGMFKFGAVDRANPSRRPREQDTGGY